MVLRSAEVVQMCRGSDSAVQRCRSAEVSCRGDFADSIVQLLIAEHVQRCRGAEVAQSRWSVGQVCGCIGTVLRLRNSISLNYLEN